jgi:hypothetical protein
MFIHQNNNKINNVLKSIDDMFGFSFLSDGEL